MNLLLATVYLPMMAALLLSAQELGDIENLQNSDQRLFAAAAAQLPIELPSRLFKQ